MAIKYTEEQLNNVDKSFLVQMFLNQQEEMAKLRTRLSYSPTKCSLSIKRCRL